MRIHGYAIIEYFVFFLFSEKNIKKYTDINLPHAVCTQSLKSKPFVDPEKSYL